MPNICDKLKVEVPYLEQIRRIRTVLEHTLSYFPSDRCDYSARVVKTLVPDLKEVAGEYRPWQRWHAWNYDRERGLYVDLSFDQFAPIPDEVKDLENIPSTVTIDGFFGVHFQGVTIFPKKTSLLRTINSRTHNQRSRDDNVFVDDVERICRIYSEIYSKN